MRPVLFELGPLTVHSYGAMMAVAAMAAWLVTRRLLAERAGGTASAAAAPIVLAAVIGGFVGARIYYALEHVAHEPLDAMLGGAGFTWYGGALGGAIAVLIAAWRLRVPLDAILTAAAVALPLAYAIGRIGCQLAGDGTYGVASDLPWAMSYPDGEDPTSERVHPAPLYESLASFAAFALLWRWRGRLPPVRLFAAYLMLAGTARFLVEFVRRNDEVAAGLTQPQLFAAVSVAAGLALFIGRLGPHAERATPGSA